MLCFLPYPYSQPLDSLSRRFYVREEVAFPGVCPVRCDPNLDRLLQRFYSNNTQNYRNALHYYDGLHEAGRDLFCDHCTQDNCSFVDHNIGQTYYHQRALIHPSARWHSPGDFWNGAKESRLPWYDARL